MKTIALFTLLLAAVATGTNAQGTTIPVSQLKPASIQPLTQAGGIGNLIVQFTEHINPSAFTPEFLKNKKGWEEKANATNDPKGAAWLLQSLQSGLKPSSFTPTWAMQKDNWLGAVNSIKTVKDATSPLKVLSSSVSPTMLNSGWLSSKNAWSTAVDAIK